MKRSLCVTALVALLPSVAFAQATPAPAQPAAKSSADSAAAQSLFDQGRTLMQSGRFAEACPKLEESLRLEPGIGTAFNLADCNEHVGKIATAWAGFLGVAAQAKAKKQTEREAVARKRAAAIEKRIPKLVIEAPSNISGLEVKRDGIVVGTGAWGSEVAVDPGAHSVSATAPGREQWQTTIQAGEGKTTRVQVPRDLRVLPTPVAAVPVTPAPVATPPEPQPQPQTTAFTATPPVIDERDGSTQRTLGYAVGGVGIVGLAAGGIFGLMSLSKRNESDGHCQGDVCNSDGVELRSDAIRNGNISTVASIAGGAALLGGIVLVLTSPRGARGGERGSIQLAPRVADRSGGLFLQGTLP